MPYPPQHKAATRARIVSNARRLFNARGFDGVSIDAIMAAAGLTRGGFYHHFDTKEELYVEAVLEFMANPPAANWDGVRFDPTAPAAVFARQLIDAYLSANHLADCDSQCPMVALPSDIRRAGPEIRTAFERVFATMRGCIARGIGEGDRSDRTLAIVALCVGGMVLARTVNDPGLAQAVRQAAHGAALDTAGFAAPRPAPVRRRATALTRTEQP